MSITSACKLVIKNLLLNIIIFFFTVSFLFPTPYASAQEVNRDIPPQQTSGAEREYQFLKDQTQEFRNFIQTERQEHQQFLERTIKYLGGLLAVATVFGLGNYWLALQEAKKVGVKGVARAIRRNEEELRDVLEETTRKILGERLNLKKPVLIITNGLEQGEDKKMIDWGMTNLTVKSYSKNLDLSSPQVIIFHYDGKDKKDLEATVERLLKERKNKPIIVYSKSRVDSEKLESYELRGYANAPLTLVNALYTTLNTLD